MRPIVSKKAGPYMLLLVGLVALLLVPSQGSAATLLPTMLPTVMSNTTIAVAAPSSPVQVGEEFDVPVTLTTDVPTWGMQFELAFDPALIEITGVDEGTFYSDWANAHNATAMSMPKPLADNAKGLVPTTAYFLVGAEMGQGPSGSGTLAILHVRAKQEGTTELRLGNIEVNDAGVNDGTTVALGGVLLQNGVIAVGTGAAALQPTAAAMVEATGVPATMGAELEPTIERLVPAAESDASGEGGIPWVIVLPVLGAVVLGAVAIGFLRKR